MAIQIREQILNSVSIQSGVGVPTHIEPLGTLYIDRNSGLLYINKNGVNTWSVFTDVSMSGAGVTSINAGTGINVSSPSGIVTVTNTAPDQTVVINGGTNIGVSGTYPNFTLNFTGNVATTDVFVTGGTYSNGTITFKNNTGGTFNVAGLYTGNTTTDVFVTGGTYSLGTITFKNNTGGTFTVSGLYTGGTDVFVTGGTYTAGTITFRNNTGGTFTVSGFTTATTTNYWSKSGSTIYPTNGEYLGFGISAATAWTHFKNTTGQTDFVFEILEPSNYGQTYGTYLGQPTGVADRFYRGWAMNNSVNPTSNRPDVVGTFWSYNTNMGGGRFNSSEAAFSFRTETHYEAGGQQLFEIHTPAFVDTGGTEHRLMSWYTPKFGVSAGGPRIETDAFSLMKWGDQNTTWMSVDDRAIMTISDVRSGGTYPLIQLNTYDGYSGKLNLQGTVLYVQHGDVTPAIGNPAYRTQTMDNFWVGQQPGYGGSPTNDQRGLYIGGWLDMDNRSSNIGITLNHDGSGQWLANFTRSGGSIACFAVNKGAIWITYGPTSERPSPSYNGMIRYNTDTNKFEAYENSNWVNVINSGSVATDVFVTGGTYTAGTLTLKNNTGGTFTVSGFTTGATTSAATIYTSNGTINGNRLVTMSSTTLAFCGGTVAMGSSSYSVMNYGQIPNLYVPTGAFLDGVVELPTTLRIIASSGGINFGQQSAPSTDSQLNFGNDTNGIYLGNYGAKAIRFVINNAEIARFATTSGNLLVGTQTDSGYKLDVNGMLRATAGTITNGFSASTISATTYLNLPSSSATTIYNGDGTLVGNRVVGLSSFTLNFSSATQPNALVLSGGNVLIGTNINSGYKLDVAGTGRIGGLELNNALTYVNGLVAVYKNPTLGLVLAGAGSSYDVFLSNSVGGTALAVPAGTTDVNVGGTLTAGGNGIYASNSRFSQTAFGSTVWGYPSAALSSAAITSDGNENTTLFLFSGGNVSLGSSFNSGYKFSVSGSMKAVGAYLTGTLTAATVSATTYLNLPSSSATTIYNGDGTLSSNRIVGLGTNTLNFSSSTGSTLFLSGNTGVVINGNTFDPISPEALSVSAKSTTSYNIISAHANVNNYTQLNIHNYSSGNSASSDIVATNNIGNESSYYIDMGINGSGFTGTVGIGNDAYLYNQGRDLWIGNITGLGTGNVRFFANTGATTDMILSGGSGNLGIGIGTGTPTNRLVVSAVTDPIKVIGLQSANDPSVVTIDATGVMHTIPMTNVTGGSVNAVTGGTYSGGTITLSGTGNVNGNRITGLTYINYYAENPIFPIDAPLASGSSGIAIGRAARAGVESISIGSNAGSGVTTPLNSIVIGYQAGALNNNNTNSINIGYQAGLGNPATTNTTAANVYVGYQAGYQATGTTNSTAVGYQAGYQTTGNSQSVFFGYQAGFGSGVLSSTYIGYQAGYNTPNQNGNTLVGYRAGYNTTSTSNNVFIGSNVGQNITSVSSSVYIGNTINVSSGTSVVFIGNGVGSTNSNQQVAIGNSAGSSNGSTDSIAIGNTTLNGVTGSTGTIAMGYRTAYLSSSALTNCVIIGYTNTFSSNITAATSTVAIGQSGVASADNGVFIGFSTGTGGRMNAHGSVAIGYQAGYFNSAPNSVAIGFQAGFSNNITNSSIANSVIMGNQAGYFNSAFTNSVAIGWNAGRSFSTLSNTGSYAVYIGPGAGYGITASSFNTLIGYQAGSVYNSGGTNTNTFLGNNNIIIGTNVTLGSGATNSLNIGGVLFGNNMYSTTSGFASYLNNPTGQIGINVVPSAITNTFHVSATTDPVRFQGITGASDALGVTIDSNGVLHTKNIINLTAATFTVTGTGYVTAINSGTSLPQIVMSGTDTFGGAGYYNFLKVTNNYAGATGNSKTFRVQSGGTLEIINSAYNASLFQLTDTGNLLINGSITMVNRPAFRATGTTSTGIAATTTITATQGAAIDYNQGGYYNNTTGIFTAPIAGLYHVYFNCRTGTAGQQQVIILKNNTNSMLMWETNANTGHFGVSGILYLAVNDNLRATVAVGTVQFDPNDSWGAAYIG